VILGLFFVCLLPGLFGPVLLKIVQKTVIFDVLCILQLLAKTPLSPKTGQNDPKKGVKNGVLFDQKRGSFLSSRRLFRP
jgi:hypothetical protein